MIVFDMFEGGKKLLPPDPIEEKVKILQKTTEFSEEAFTLAFERYWKRFGPKSLMNKLRKKGITITHHRPVSFDTTEKSLLAKKWERDRVNFFSKISFRLAM